MNKHIFLIDNIEKLNIKKDSSLMMAHSFSEIFDVYICQERDFSVINSGEGKLRVHTFNSVLKDDFYMESFELASVKHLTLDHEAVIHMRIDPPYDGRYQSFLWLLNFLRDKHGVQVANDPNGIMAFNEKIIALELPQAIKSYIGSSLEDACVFLDSLKKEGEDFVIMKPLNLFSGIGVSKLDLKEDNSQKIKESLDSHGLIILQPFLSAVYDGEVRSIFYKQDYLGSILKVPVKGDFLSNIAQGAKFHKVDIDEQTLKICGEINKRLSAKGVDLVAYDILGGVITEVNTTCPGLLVELSHAHGKNFCLEMAKK